MPISAVDINCDLGEGFGCWQLGENDDSDLMPHISSASIAAGFHAGDPNLVDRTVRLAVEHGIGIGAHPGYHDLQGFGRRPVGGTANELVNDIIYQVGAVREFVRRHGGTLQHVKPHGALYMTIAGDADLSKRFVDYMRNAAPSSFIFCMTGSAVHSAACEAGHPVVREFYADRDYEDSGSIVFVRNRNRPDPEELAEKCLRACRENTVRTITGNDIRIEFESICVHSDTPGALDVVSTVRQRLNEDGIRITPVSELVAI